MSEPKHTIFQNLNIQYFSPKHTIFQSLNIQYFSPKYTISYWEKKRGEITLRWLFINVPLLLTKVIHKPFTSPFWRNDWSWGGRVKREGGINTSWDQLESFSWSNLDYNFSLSSKMNIFQVSLKIRQN